MQRIQLRNEVKAPLGVTVLGATGSVGRQALEVIRAFPERFRVVALSANRDVPAMAELVRQYQPEVVGMADYQAADQLKKLLGGKAGVEVEAGPECLPALASAARTDVVVAAIIGSAGLPPLYAAVCAGKHVALANKESMVMAGELLMREARLHHASVLPVDSEHAAVHQLLRAVPPDRIRRVILTASGGPFLGRSRRDLSEVTSAEALAHPNWAMGAKISIDSATMMNKGFEVIEARWLFDLPAERIGVIIHPESVVHALLETVDGFMLAQMAEPDMRLPIAYALGCPEQFSVSERISHRLRLDLTRVARLTFQEASCRDFPALEICRLALQKGGTVPAALSVADEVVVDAFLRQGIGFTQITDLLGQVLDRIEPAPLGKLEDALAAGQRGAELARELLAKLGG